MTPIRFDARLGKRERLFFALLGCGLFLGMSLLMGIIFSIAFETLEPLLLPAFFFVGFLLIMWFRPTGYVLNGECIGVIRPAGVKKFAIADVCEVRRGIERPTGTTIGIARADGFFGVFGSFWNREWGKFYVYVTDATKSLQIRFRDGGRLFISPSNTTEFIDMLKAVAGLPENNDR